MSAVTETTAGMVRVRYADEVDAEMAIHALHGILEALDWIDSVQIGVSEDRLREGRTGLLLAGRLITADFRRRL